MTRSAATLGFCTNRKGQDMNRKTLATRGRMEGVILSATGDCGWLIGDKSPFHSLTLQPKDLSVMACFRHLSCPQGRYQMAAEVPRKTRRPQKPEESNLAER